jgi:phospholipid-binding lipoprotein MlaA
MKTNALVLTLCLLSGCATLPEGTQISPADPFERMNRATFTFNEKFDDNIAQPVARAYVKVFPSFVRTGVGNFFGNINDVWTSFNHFLQGNPQNGFSDIMRVSFNSTYGLLGFLDMASEAGIPKHNTNMGQTLGVWGVPNGPYFVIPFLGPSVVRDTAALPIDYYGDLWNYYHPVWIRNTGTVLRLVDKRAAYLDASTLMDDAALDKYIFIRDAYLQRVASQIEKRKHGGKMEPDLVEQDETESSKHNVANEVKTGTPTDSSSESK